MSVTVESKSVIAQSVYQNKEAYITVSKAIHANPEIGNQEVFASEQLVKVLREANFIVDTAVAGHETSFYAHKDSGKPGPTIAYLAEYDALPGLGHACGHNIIGVTSIAAAIALAETIDTVGGKVIVLGTPAEEGGPNGSAKGSFVRHGFLKNVDIAMMLHPSGKTGVTNESLAVDPLDFHFYGKAAHASASPDKGINALDAVIQLFNSINALRQHVPSDVRIHGIITHGGDAPNIVPDYASARFYIRATSWSKTEEVSNKIRQIAEGAALATGATVKVERFQNEVKDLVVNEVIDRILAEKLSTLGEDVHPRGHRSPGSTDAGNISYEVPTSHGYIKIGTDDLVAHTNEFRDAANSDKGYEALITGAIALAETGFAFLQSPKLVKEAKATHQQALKAKALL
ncbi:MAG: M20 family metallopeptidase [Solibacillus sp.]|uniref:M20 family metallopeptidase n=1 Tax=unclassified Solibacillus TaxID=2637870 RepID=UPI0030FA42DF